MNQYIFKPFPTLKTNRLTFRQLTSEDRDLIFKLRTDDLVNIFLDRPVMSTIDEAQAFIEKINGGIAENKWIYWGICLNESNVIIGTVCLWNYDKDENRGEIGFELMSDFHGQGIMGEALTVVLDFAFGAIRLNEIEGYTRAENLGAICLMEKNGFSKKSDFVEKRDVDEIEVKMVVYGIQKSL